MALEFFSNTSQFRKWARGLDASADLDEMAASYNTAKEKVLSLLEQSLWDSLLAYHGNPEPVNAKNAQLVEYIQSALANFAMIEEFPYIAAESSRDWYKYEVDNQLNRYRNNGWTALNNIISFLDVNTEDFAAWTETTAYTERQKLIISDYSEFDRIYSIDQSAYFFNRIAFLQKEVVRDIINPRIGFWEEVSGTAKIANAVRLVIVYQTMAYAVKRLDYMNLPPSIRKTVTNEQNKVIRSGYSEQAAMNTLANTLQLKADGYINDLEYEMKRSEAIDDGADLAPNPNDPENKHYLAL